MNWKYVLGGVFCILLCFSGCKTVSLKVEPKDFSLSSNDLLKQGDKVNITLSASPASGLSSFSYSTTGNAGSSTAVPHNLTVDTNKTLGNCYTELTASATATWSDGTVKSKNFSTGLTEGDTSREDSDWTYSVYVAHDNDNMMESSFVDGANGFMNGFGSGYTLKDYLWTGPAAYLQPNANTYANDVDLAVSFGHGAPHIYQAGSSNTDQVDLSTTGFGSFLPANQKIGGDADYLVFGSCSILSMADPNFWNFWFNTNASKTQLRPFTGLHQIMGFRTVWMITYWHIFDSFIDSTADDLFGAFADNLNDNLRVIDAWQEAVGDECDFSDGNNRGAVLFLSEYTNDTIKTKKKDYVYGNSKYNSSNWTMDFWED